LEILFKNKEYIFMCTKQTCLWLVLLVAGLSYAVPPKVIKTMPENGDSNVKPGPVKVRIQFDQDMDQGGMSITGVGENFPDIVGKPQWAGKRIIAFNAKLKPNHEYEFGINSQSFQKFKNTKGEPAEISRVWFKTSGAGGAVSDANSVSQLTTEQNKAAIEKLKNALARNYSYNKLRKVDWNAALEQYRQRLLKAKTPQEFARIAGLLLAAAKDKHIWLMVDGKHIPAYVNPVTPNANFKLLPKLVPDFQKRSNAVCTGRFPDGIGYILIDSWGGQEKEFEPLYAALKEFADAPGMIIDVRGNGGGSETVARKFAGCFIDKPALYSKNQNIKSDATGGFGPMLSRYVKPNEEGPKYRGKVAVLAGPVVISSCESFVLMMKQVPGCKVIGQTTQGSSGNPKPHDLGNGVEVYLPSWKDFLPDGTCIEGKGIDPDIVIEVTPDKITTNDPVIDAALKELRKS
jgi:hypothetical protein